MKKIKCITYQTVIIFLFTYFSVFAQSYSLLNEQMQAISDVSSIQGWIKFKEEAKVDPNTLFQNHKEAFALSAEDSMVLYRKDIDNLGNRHFRYQQTYNNIRVEGAVYLVHEKSGFAVTANGNIFNDLDIDINPLITAKEACNVALGFINADIYMWEDTEEEQFLKRTLNDENATYYPKSELVILPSSSKQDASKMEAHLVFKFDIYAKQPMSRNYIYIDAKSGDVELVLDRVRSGDVIGTAETDLAVLNLSQLMNNHPLFFAYEKPAGETELRRIIMHI